MKTEAGTANGQGTAEQAKTANRVSNRPSIPGKDKNHENHADQTPAPAAEAEKGKDGEAKGGSPAPVDHQPANPEPGQAAEVKAEVLPEVKEDVKAEPLKPALNLEQTLKSVDYLHRKSIQRIALISRIKLLEDFEVKLIEENDELESNPYQGCKLIIEDDKRRQFTTNTPNLIRMVSQFIFDACLEKLAEIEANIVFPNA